MKQPRLAQAPLPSQFVAQRRFNAIKQRARFFVSDFISVGREFASLLSQHHEVLVTPVGTRARS